MKNTTGGYHPGPVAPSIADGALSEQSVGAIRRNDKYRWRWLKVMTVANGFVA